MLIDKTLLDSLTVSAKESPRLRMNCDLRNSPEDYSQRQLNALEPGTIIPIHRHKSTSETIVVLRGKLLWKHYDNNGVETESFVIQAYSDNCGITSPKGQWHSLDCLESGTIIIEMKDGAWAPLEEDEIMVV